MGSWARTASPTATSSVRCGAARDRSFGHSSPLILRFGGSGGQRPPDSPRMAQAEHLPIYKASYDLCLYLEQVVRSFSRYYKYTLGADLRDGARRGLKGIVRGKRAAWQGGRPPPGA